MSKDKLGTLKQAYHLNICKKNPGEKLKLKQNKE